MSVLFAYRLREKNQLPPSTPTNAERVQAYRALAPVQLGNATAWKWHAAQYAREAAPSSEAEYINQLREGAAFKYGEMV